MSNAKHHKRMSVFRVALAAVAGALLYYAAVAYFGGVLAAISVPKAYFTFFGRERLDLAVVVLDWFTWALPVLAAVALGAFVVLRFWRGSLRSCLWALGGGMLASLVYLQADFALLMAGQSSPRQAFGQAFTSTLLPAWWAAPNVLAPWAGLALAAWIVARRRCSGLDA